MQSSQMYKLVNECKTVCFGKTRKRSPYICIKYFKPWNIVSRLYNAKYSQGKQEKFLGKKSQTLKLSKKFLPILELSIKLF